jgi:DNA-binding CsgD family transcriptional regulator
VPPDDVAIYPGLRPWAASCVEAATGGSAAVALAFEAFAQARVAGCPISAVAYLNTAARFGAAERAAAALDEWGVRFDAPISAGRAMSVRARAHGDGKALLEAAEYHAAIGALGEALALAELAGAAGARHPADVRAKAEALAAEMRRRLRRPGSAGGNVVALTSREQEVATLAAKGMSDREIADALVVSIRTVESHLAAVYRKLGLTSRRDLRDLRDLRDQRDQRDLRDLLGRPKTS